MDDLDDFGKFLDGNFTFNDFMGAQNPTANLMAFISSAAAPGGPGGAAAQAAMGQTMQSTIDARQLTAFQAQLGEAAQLRQQLAEAQEARRAAEQEARQARKEADDLRAQIASLQQAVATAQQAAQALKQQNTSLQGEMSRVNAENVRLQARAQAAADGPVQELRETAEALACAQRRGDALEEEAGRLREALSSANAELAAKTERQAALTQEDRRRLSLFDDISGIIEISLGIPVDQISAQTVQGKIEELMMQGVSPASTGAAGPAGAAGPVATAVAGSAGAASLAQPSPLPSAELEDLQSKLAAYELQMDRLTRVYQENLVCIRKWIVQTTGWRLDIVNPSEFVLTLSVGGVPNVYSRFFVDNREIRLMQNSAFDLYPEIYRTFVSGQGSFPQAFAAILLRACGALK